MKKKTELRGDWHNLSRIWKLGLSKASKRENKTFRLLMNKLPTCNSKE